MTLISLAEYRSKFSIKKGKKRRVVKGQRVQSEGEVTLARDLRALKIGFEQEYKFHAERKWRADFWITGTKILVEIEGGIWSGGRHTRGKGYIGDMEKYNGASMMGFIVLRFSTAQVKSGLAVKQIEKMIGGFNDTNDR